MTDYELVEVQTTDFEPLPPGVPPLRSFYLYLVTGCNLACRHCWITPTFYKSKPAAGDVMDYDILEGLIIEGKKMGLGAAKLTGGEPTLHPRFRDIADMLTKHGIHFNMETNGTLMTQELANHLRQNTNLNFVSVSIDGSSAASHDYFRAVPGAFDSAWRGVDYLVKAGFPVQVIMCPYEGNYKEIDDVVRQAVEHGAGSVKFNPVTNAGRGGSMQKRGETFGSEEIMALARYIRGELQDRTPIPLMIGLPPVFSNIQDLLRLEGVAGSCGVHGILGLLGSGEMALCGIGRNVPDMVFGIMGKSSLRDVWVNNNVLKGLREAMAKPFPGICGDCIHAQNCLTHCAAHNFLDYGELIHPAKLCQDLYEAGNFPESRRITGKPIEVKPVPPPAETRPNVVLY